MKPQSKLLMLIASLLLIGTYFVPIWSISLDAPQYPEGLGLEIWLNDVRGENPHDLNKINNLNHYIGMKTIEPDSILELKYMPFIIGFMILFGLVAAASGKRTLVIAWVVTFVILGIAGMYDFWLWGYDYGHNLDAEHAIIKIPGMSYQPPLIGSKQLLNFYAVSLPAIGGYLVLISVGLGVLAGYLDFKSTRKNQKAVTNEQAVQKTKQGNSSAVAYGAVEL